MGVTFENKLGRVSQKIVFRFSLFTLLAARHFDDVAFIDLRWSYVNRCID